MLPSRTPARTGGARHYEGEGLCGFTTIGDTFALCTGGGLVKIYECASGELKHTLGISEGKDGHLATQYKALCWALSTSKTPGKSKKTKGAAAGANSLLILGSGTGEVMGWDVALGEVIWRAAACHVGAVTSLAFCAATGIIYSCGADAQICEISAATGDTQGKWKAGKHALSAVAVSPDGTRLLVASAALSLYDLASRERLTKMSGHGVATHTVAFSPNGLRAISAAPSERHVAVWDCEATSSKAKGAVAVLSMEHPVVQLSSSRASSSDDEFHVVAVSEVGEAYVWRCGLKGSAIGSYRIKVVVPPSMGDLDTRECILAARHGVQDGTMVVRGSLARPTFQHVESPSKDGSVLELVAAVEDGVLKPRREGPAPSTSNSSQNAHVLDAENATDATHARPTLANGTTTPRRKREADVSATAPIIETVVTGDGEPMDEDEATIGDRLAKLGAEGLDAAAPEAARGGPGAAAVRDATPKADSLGVLLSQAVRAQDKNLLERCLSVADDKVVRNTVARLQPTDALSLLEQLLLKLQSRPSRGVQLSRWLRAVVIAHPAYLMAAPAARPHLAMLYQLLEARLGMMKPLMSLAGRLDFLLAQHQPEDEQTEADGPLVEYIEPDVGHDGDVEVEDPFAAEGSDEEWETDNDTEGDDVVHEESEEDLDEMV